MGMMVEGECRCGFKTDELALGGGMGNFETYAGAPAVCSACCTVGAYNVLAKRPRCRTCRRGVRFYTTIESEPSGATLRHEGVVFDWNIDAGTLLLREAGHACPKCKRDTMRFSPTALWD